MTEQRVGEVLSLIGGKVPQEKLLLLRDKLYRAEDSRADQVLTAKLHSSTTIVQLSVFLGGLGIDRFVIGDIGLGVGKLLVGWLTLGIWPLVDIFFSYKKAKEKNFNKIMMLLP